MYRPLLIILLLASLCGEAPGQRFVPNYDESRVPSFALPDPLISESGESISDPKAWNESRRSEILELFEDHVYGVMPEAIPVVAKVISRNDSAVGGLAIRREIDLTLGTGSDATVLSLVIYTPVSEAKSESSASTPCFLGLNFAGNHSIDADPSIQISTAWMRPKKNGTTDGNRATEAGRGTAAKRWDLRQILQRGYGLVTLYYGDIDPDFDDGFKNGIHRQLAEHQQRIAPERRGGSITAWAYGLSRVMDYLERDRLVDADRIAVVGHSRLGKAALWAGANDSRFAMVISNNSGCGGAALSRRAFGETIARINQSFPHWFNDKFNEYNGNESACPVDQHQLIALIAPRPVYVASATKDRWADPRGEFLACVHADPVYRLLGNNGMGGLAPPRTMPAPETPLLDGTIGYHLRTGKHDVTPYDWSRYIDFADRHLRR